MNLRPALLITAYTACGLARLAGRNPRITATALIGLVAVRLACSAGEPDPQGRAAAEFEPQATLTVDYTIRGVGQTCSLYRNNVDQNQHAYVVAATQEYVKLIFARTPTALSYFHFTDGQAHHLVSANPSSGSSNVVEATFLIPLSVGTHVDGEMWVADVKQPPCVIKVTIERE